MIIILAYVRVIFSKNGMCTFSCHGNTVGVALRYWSPVGSIYIYQLEELMNSEK